MLTLAGRTSAEFLNPSTKLRLVPLPLAGEVRSLRSLCLMQRLLFYAKLLYMQRKCLYTVTWRRRLKSAGGNRAFAEERTLVRIPYRLASDSFAGAQTSLQTGEKPVFRQKNVAC